MPTWEAVNTGLPSTEIALLKGDPWRPSVRQYCMVDDGGGLTWDNALYRRENGGSWEKILDNAAATAACGFATPTYGAYIQGFDVNINVDGYIAAAVAIYQGGNYQKPRYVLVSTDYGTTWSAAYHIPDALTYVALLNPTFGGLFVGAFGGGNVLYAPMYSQGVFTGDHLLVSIDGGATWSEGVVTDWEAHAFSPDAYQETGYKVGTTSPAGLYRIESNGASSTLLKNLANIPANLYAVHALYPGDGSKATTLRLLDLTGSVNTLYKSTDAGASWDAGTAMQVATPAYGISLLHDAPNNLYLIALGSPTTEHHIYASTDEGATMEGKAGTDRSASTTTGIPQDAGAVAGILQVWA